MRSDVGMGIGSKGTDECHEPPRMLNVQGAWGASPGVLQRAGSVYVGRAARFVYYVYILQ